MTNNKLSPVTVYVPVHIKDATGIYSRSNRTPSDAPVFLKEQERFLFTKSELETLLMNCYNDGAWNEQDGKHAQKGQANVLIKYIESLF